MTRAAIVLLAALVAACDSDSGSGSPTAPSQPISVYDDCAEYRSANSEAWGDRYTRYWHLWFDNTCDYEIVVRISARMFSGNQPVGEPQLWWLELVGGRGWGRTFEFSCGACTGRYQIAFAYRSCRVNLAGDCDYPPVPTEPVD